MKAIVSVLFILAFATLHSQTLVSINEHGGPEVTCDMVSFDTESSVYKFTGNVSFDDGNISIQHADKVVLNAKKGKLTATGEIQASIRAKGGTIIAYDMCSSENVLSHKLGSRKLFINKDCQ